MALFPCFKTAPASPGVRRAIPGGAAFARAVLLGCLLLALAGMARAQQAALSGFEWTTPEDRIEFQLRFTAAPTMRVTDNLAAKHYFYLDFTNVSGPAEEARWNPPSPLIEHVRRVYYPQQKVLRFVFYTNKDIRFDAVARGEREFDVVVSPIRITPLAEAGRTGGPRKLIVIDPGHGGWPKQHSIGAATSKKVNGKILYEKDLVLDISKRLQRLIEKSPNLQATMTRTQDVYVSLLDRIDMANEAQGDLFLSVHLNGTDAKVKTARGFEVYYLTDGTRETNRQLEAIENDETTTIGGDSQAHEDIREILRGLFSDKLVEQTAESAELAEIIGNEFERLGPFREHYRGVKRAAFRVLMNVTMPSVLIECGFVDHPIEGEELAKPEVQEKIAALLFNAINRYFAKQDLEFVPYYLPGGETKPGK